MAAPEYTTDLVDISTCEALGTWVEPTGFADGTGPVAETDFFIQSPGSGTTHCISKALGTGTTASAGCIFDSASGKTIPSPGAFMIWLYFAAPNALAVQASGGFQVFCGSALSAFQQWYVRGSDTYPYGGWVCIPVDPAVAESTHTGTPSGTKQWFGAGIKLGGIAVSKGNPLGIDAVRYGRCEARVAKGATADGYATFAGLVAVNDTVANRWGLLQAVQGGYLMQGLIVLGYVTACDFRDANRNIFIADTEKVIASFNAFEVRQAGSRVDWTAISITALGTVSRGNFVATDNATINITSCTFTDMGTWGFLAASTIILTTFRRCGLVTQGGATITNCVFDSGRDSASVLASNPSLVTGCTFTSDGSNHAIEATTAGDYNSNNTYSGYAASDGSTGNEAFYNNSGGHINLTVTGGTIPKVRNAGASTTTVIVPDVTLTLTGLVSGSDIVILTAGTSTERVNVDQNAGTTYDFNYTYAASDYVDICVFKAGYVPFAIRNYLLAIGDGSVPIAQVVDRNYLP